MNRARFAVCAGLLLASGAGAASACGMGDPGSPASGAGAESPPAMDGATTDEARVDAGPVRAPFGLDVRPANPTCLAPLRPATPGPPAFEAVFTNVSLVEPMMLAQAPGDPSRWFVALREGKLAWFAATSPSANPTVVADLGLLSGFAVQAGGEGGLLGFAFHPKFLQNGRVYVTWTSTDGVGEVPMKSRVGYVTSPDGGLSFTSYTNLIAFDQIAFNHNGGGIAFGRDGLLYLSFGDGGAAEGNGQRTDRFFSKIARIDVDGPKTAGLEYAIPADNPFATGGGEPATFAFGFRNPFRISVDQATGDLWAGDVGHAAWEEIDLVKKGGNYGWSCLEANHPFIPNDPFFCPNGLAELLPPIIEHDRETARSITGGVVYRGKAIPSLVGSYVYGDFSLQGIFALTRDPTTGAPRTTRINDPDPIGRWIHFATDLDGEIHAVDFLGRVHKIVPGIASGLDASFPSRLSKTGCVQLAAPTQPAAGVIPFGVNAEAWTDGAAADRFFAVPDGAVIDVEAQGDLVLPSGSVTMQTFAFAGKRIETRLLVRHMDGDWAGYSYEWLDDQSDAVLLNANKRKVLTVGGPGQPSVDWYFPSRGECMLCHTAPTGRTPGLELGQLNGDFVYTSTHRISNQLATLAHLGYLRGFTGPTPTTPLVPSPHGGAPLDPRARAYLHANCAPCHQPQGGTRSLDLRFSTALIGTGACNDAKAGTLGVAGAKILVPGAPSRSLLSIRAHRSGAPRMPPLGGDVADSAGLGVVDDWIGAMAATRCP